MSRKTINIKLMRRVLRHVHTGLRRLRMSEYLLRKKDYPEASRDWPKCQTIGCMAAWTVLLSMPRKNWSRIKWDSIHERARKLLRLRDDEANDIFLGRSVSAPCGDAQYARLCRDINRVLENRGMKERVQ